MAENLAQGNRTRDPPGARGTEAEKRTVIFVTNNIEEAVYLADRILVLRNCPTSVKADYAADLRQIESYLPKRPYCAIGEIGIDLFWDKTYKRQQTEVFEEQLRWSIDLNLPVSIHTRDAYPEVLESIYKVGPEKLSGVFHSFTGTSDDLKEIRKLAHFKIGINGVVTFKNSKLGEVLSETDLSQIVVETDAPYLAPVPYRGKRNEPVYIWKTVEKLAQIYQISREKVVFETRKNTLSVFKNVNKSL